ncbi:hypothetical protein RMCBS344292_16447 [Rhizopus microsporus]|nr:hypothetical protein RMCBS344292_16447 [Rhizopus microsporus]
MAKESDDKVPSFNVSTLSRNYYFNCKKNYYLLLDGNKANKPKEQSANSPRGQTNNQPTKRNSQGDSSNSLEKEKGSKFEDKIYKSLQGNNKIAGPYKDFKKALQEAETGKYLYNQEFTVDDTFYTKVFEKDKVYEIAKFKPDFVYFISQKKIRIIEVKSSEKSEETHKIQVASYWFLIEYLIKDMGIVLDKQVGIWLPSDEENPKLFSIHSKIGKDKGRTIFEEVKELYETTLPNIIKSGEYEWDLQKKCRNCDYYKRCKKDAEGTVKELPYHNKERRELYMKNMLKDIEDTVRIDDFAERLQVATRLQGYAKSRKIEKPIFFGYTTTLVSEKVDCDIYVSFLKDGFTRYPYAFAFRIFPKVIRSNLEYCLNKSYYQKDDTQREDAFCEITKRFIEALYKILGYMNDQNKSCLFYVYDNNEMYNIKNFLSDLVSSQGKDLKSLESEEKEDVVKKATKCLVALFQDGTLLDVPTLEELPCLDKIEKNAMTERFVVIEQLLEQNVALPAQVYYEVSDAVKWMVDRKAVVYNFKKEWEKFSKNKTGDDQFAKKTKKKQIELLEQLDKVMEKYRELSKTITLATTEMFPLSCPKFKWPRTFDCNIFGYNNQILAKILYFTEYIRLFKQRQCQGAPIADLDIICGYKTSSKLSSLTLVLKESKDGSHTFVVDTTGNGGYTEYRLKSLEYDKTNGYKHILVPDTYKDIVKMFKYMHDLGNYEREWITVLNILNVDKDNRMVKLRAGLTSAKTGQRFRLYKTYEDKNENHPFKNMFEALDEAAKKSIVDLLQDPNEWSMKDTFGDIDFNSSETKESLHKFSLLRSQQKAVESIMERRLKLIWGSSEVKRQFLAQFIHWYASYFVKHNQSKRLVIGVAANSNESVRKLLQEVEEIEKQERSESDGTLSIVYVHDNGEKKDKKSIIYYAQAEKVSNATIYQKRATVVGTKFSHWEYVKKRKEFSNVRMMIIDDGSKAHVHDALLPLGCLSSTRCKLIVAGDINHNQSPFSYGYYRTTTSDNTPLLYGSIQQCLTRKECKCYNRKECNVAIEIDGKKVNNLKNLGPNTLKLRNEI